MNLWSTTAGKIFMTFLISMVPVIELRGAIPIAVANGLNYWVAVAVSIIGNLVPVPFIILFIRKIFTLMRKISVKLDGVVTKLEQRAAKKSDVVQKYAFWGLFVLVAIPLPGTGAWTGALVAAMLDMRLKRAFPAIALGVLAAAAIVTFVTYGVDVIFT
jgi:uncharacterized membrane protein